MAYELHQVLHQLSLIDSHLSTSASTVEDIISKAYISFTAPQLLTAISDAKLDAVVYCRSVECLVLSASIDWLFPKLAVLLQHQDDQDSDRSSTTSLPILEISITRLSSIGYLYLSFSSLSKSLSPYIK